MTDLFSPFMAASCTTRLTKKHVKVCSSLLAAGPELQTLVKNWNSGVMGAHGVIAMRAFVGCVATSILAGGSNCYFSVKFQNIKYILLKKSMQCCNRQWFGRIPDFGYSV